MSVWLWVLGCWLAALALLALVAWLCGHDDDPPPWESL